jgi:SAM-dependent methyltransferase
MGDEQYWDTLASFNDKLYSSTWCNYEDQILKSDLLNLLRRVPGNRVLDLGCGTGLGYELLKDQSDNFDYLGVDISSEMLSVFKSKYPEANLIKASANDISEYVNGRQFDLIISTNVAASFFPNIDNVIEHAYGLLATDGIVSLSVLNRFSLRRILGLKFFAVESNYRSRGDISSTLPISANTYYKGEMKRKFSAMGFQNVVCQYRSILGGVFEDTRLLELEKILSKSVPGLGHAMIVSGHKM